MKKRFRKVLAFMLCLAMLTTFCAVPMTAGADGAPLKFGSDGKFKIVIFSDVQDQFPVHQRVINIMRQAIVREEPDLVVFLGDITEQNIKDPEVDYRRTVEQIFSPVVEAGIPYAVVFGNHDDQSYYSGQRTDKAAMLSVIQSLGDCRTVDADPSLFGTGTCKIPVYSSDGSSIAFDLFMVDSNTYRTPTDGSSGYDNPHADQVAWLAANKDAGVNSMVFQHIPMPEIYNLLKEDANGSKTYGDKKYAKELNENASGYLGEFPNPTYASNNMGEFETLKEMGGVLNVFTGHDHLNDFTGTYDGISMTAVPGMTYFNYGKEEVRGYGVIELNESDTANYDYHSVKFSTLDEEAGGAQETTYDTYDVVTYADLRKDGNPLPETDYNIHGSNTFTYEGTSPSHSAIFKFRWTAGADNVGFQFSFDEGEKGNIAYPFGVWIKRPGQGSAGSFGAWHLRPNQSDRLVNMKAAVKQGDVYNIELGKLKILTGEPQHVGEYYLYLKVNGVLIQEAYSNASDDGQFMSGNALCQMENKIRFGDWSSSDDNNRISAYDFESYAPYDEITYEDLLDTGDHHLAEGGTTLTAQNNLFHYEATSPSHSAIYKLRWIAGNDIYFQLHPGVYGSSNNFAYRINGTNWNQRNPSADVPIGYTINEGDHVDIEIGRLLVADGDNAGKYYTYFKAGKKVIFEKYVSAEEANTTGYLADSIQLNLRDSAHYCEIGPIIEEVEEEPADALYYKYDEIEYGDLLLGGNYLGGETSIDGGKTFTYNKTSSTGSVILKYRWTAVEDAQFQISFDTGKDGKVNYMFGAQLYKPGVEDHANSSIRLRPGLDAAAWVELAENIVGGQSYDVEFARLKVKNGENAGKYYVYFKMDGELISESYVNEGVVDSKGNYKSNPGDTDCHISNEIYMTAWGNSGNKISSIPGETAYYDYDEVYYGDLLLNDKPLAMETTMNGGKTFTYNKTSPTGSVILRYRWTAVEGTKFQISFDTGKDGKVNYMFGAQLYTPGSEEGHPNSSIRLRPGYDDANAWADLAENIVDGQNYDIEFARLKVKSGENTGKYYVYFKINGELIAESYVGSNVVDGEGNYVSSPSATPGKISNEIYLTFWSASGNKISATPFPETYEDYDEIYYSDLMKSGKALPVGGTKLSGGNVFTYDRKSPTGSAILKYRWTIGTVSKFQLSFEKTSTSAMAYMFGAWLSEPGAESGFPNGRMWLRPGYGPQAGFEEALEPGTDHDIELARLKVANGPNKGKYYTYVKIDGVLIAEDYVAANVVGEDLSYYSKPNETLCSIPSNEIFLAFWGSEDNRISAVPYVEEYEDYDEIGYADLYKDGNPVPADGRTMSGSTVFTYNRTSPTGSAIFKYRWTIGTVAKFQMSFEKTKSDAMAYMFGAWLSEPGAEAGYDNGRMWLRPGYGPQAGFDYALTPGSSHNVEFARLKVKSGPNKGKYYVYIRIDNELIAEDYVAEGIVDANLDYYSKPNETPCSITSNEIFFAFWGSENNKIGAFKESAVGNHEGTRGDLDENGAINAADFDALADYLFGNADSELPAGIADFNNNSVESIDDLIAIKKYLAPVNNYEKSGELTVGTQEHLLEDETKTAEYIADATAALGATAYRLSMPIHQLYYANETNGVTVKADNMNTLKAMVAALKANGVNEILYVTDSFILPYGYSDPANNHNKTVPDPASDAENYKAWLKVNAAAFAALAAEVPEIKFFEPFNEINVIGSRLETYGIGWNATTEQQAAHRFTVAEKAGIMADLCWYLSKAVKAVDPANQVTTPSISLSSSSVVERGFLEALYQAIESGNYPTGQTLGDKRIENYFTIINIHLYPNYSDKSSQVEANVNNFAASIASEYAVIKAHNDGDSRVWLTETGVSANELLSFRKEAVAGELLGATLNKIDNDLTYIDTVITYKIADISSDVGASQAETYYGLFYSGDDMDNDPYVAKPTAKAVYSFTHAGSTDYSELDALAAKYQ